MSLILDALKKLDQEMAAGRKSSGTVADQILRQDRARPKYKSAIFLTIVAACVGAVTTIVLMVGFPVIMKPSGQAPDTSSKKLPAVPQASPTVTRPLAEAPAPRYERHEKIPADRVPLRVEPAEKKMSAKNAPRTETIAGPRTSSAPQVPDESAEAVIPLRVSGIVWQEDPQARRAVVNDVVAREGFVIDGVKIVEIRPTVVRFKKGTRSFEISVGK